MPAAKKVKSELQATKLSGSLGGEIRGIRLTEAGPVEAATIRSLLLEHLVLFFPGQQMTPDEHIAFGRLFGKLEGHPNLSFSAERPEFFELHAIGGQGAIADEWHSDLTCQAEPSVIAILRMAKCPSVGGDTMWANMYKAYEELSPPMKELCEGLTALHDSSKAHYYRVKATDRQQMQFPNAEHPVVRTHPVTGRQGLFVNRGFTLRIPQLRKNESDALLEMLYRHVETPEFQCRFKWQPNSVAFWDNRCAQHHAMFDYFPHRRYGHRVTVCGDKPFYRAAQSTSPL